MKGADITTSKIVADRESQGLPPVVTDPIVLDRVVAIMAAPPDRRKT